MKTKIKTSKLIFSSLLIFILAASVTFASNTSKITVSFENLKYFIQGKQFTANPDTPGFIYKETTYVPLRFIAESMGHSVDWNSKTKTITTKLLGESETSYLQEIEALRLEVAKLQNEIEQLRGETPRSDEVTYLTHKHGHFTLHFTPTAYKKYGYLHTEFDAITKDMFNYFNVKDIDHHVNVYIQARADRVAHANEGAFYESGQRIVVLNPDLNYDMAGDDSVKFVFIHELTHALQDSTWTFDMISKVTNNEKNWILEGHADYVAKKLSGFTQYGATSDPAGTARTQDYYLKEIQHRNGENGWKPLDWSSIDTFQRLSLHRDEYFAFEAIVNFIATNYSLAHYDLLLDEMEKGSKSADAIQAVFKKTDKTLMSEYKAFYKLK